ncbi:MAG: hypothetical protein O3A25_07860 [Acidobacteria bacterium]|nr:hypothetical protein [Acidobacteriota bacterium]
MPKSSSRKRTWIIALVSLAALGVLGMVTLIGLAVYVFTSNVDFARVTPSAAETNFEEARAQFGAARPLIQLSREDGRIHAEVNRLDQASDIAPTSLHVMAWDPEKERMVSARMPLWLLRFGDDTTVDFSSRENDIMQDLNLSIADLDHHGPGLILDYAEPDRERVLLWTE